MPALKSLTDEHQLIAELLGALHTYATRLRGGATIDPADLARFAEVFRELVDYRHHEKEEGVLLPFLARHGFDWSEGLLSDLRAEHGHVRSLLDVLCQAAAKDVAMREAAGGAVTPVMPSREERRQVAESAIAFVEVERRHMQKEERVLMPSIRERLDARSLEQLEAELLQFDETRARHAGSADVFHSAAELVRRYSEDSATLDVTGVEWTVAPVAGQGLRRVS
jgi:hemerythrin-like domain-containing protein